jgi:hypothetical protein
VTTEFIAVNQARALLATAFLASRTAAASQPWTPLRAEIVTPAGSGSSVAAEAARLSEPLTLGVRVSGRDLAQARVVWEARDQGARIRPHLHLCAEKSRRAMGGSRS